VSLPAIIETPRLTLRPLGRRDVPAIVEGVGDLAVSRWLTPVPHPYREADAEEFLAMAAATPGFWAIEEDGAFRGVVSIREELGSWLRRDAWGRGLMTEAAAAATDAWFEGGAGALRSGHHEGNAASRAVLLKIGFEETGHHRSHARALGRDVPGRTMRPTRARWEARR
jgi:RimJ/RimL family protein N-acetyltransferase